MNPLEFLFKLGRLSGGSTALDPLLQTSFFLNTQLRKSGLIPSTGIKKEYGGKEPDPVVPVAPVTPVSSDTYIAPVTPAIPPSIQPAFDGGPAQRNYEAEKRRASQLAMQDQLSKKYQVADLTNAYNTATPEEKEKIGLQIWATTNPELAQRLRPGQTGYSDIKAPSATAGAVAESSRLFSPEKLSETKRALLIQAFNKGLK